MSTVAAIQMVSGCDVEKNLTEARRLLKVAAEEGASLAVLPENFALMGLEEQDRVSIAEKQGEGPIQQFLAELASSLGVWIIGGTIPLAATDDRVASACLVYDAQGRAAARYDKIHLFDVSIPSAEESYRESRHTIPGRELVTVDTPVGHVGLAVCYDLRFPEMFRRLAEKGAALFAVPSAFTAATGRAHWEVLVRARAIENLSYVIAAGQGGVHENGRETHGHSIIVDGWGRILRELPAGSGVIVADIDLQAQSEVRSSFPVLDHRTM